jgi:hypothetical protein
VDSVVEKGYAASEQTAKYLGDDESQGSGDRPAEDCRAKLRVGMAGVTARMGMARVAMLVRGVFFAAFGGVVMCAHRYYGTCMGIGMQPVNRVVRQFDT